MSQKSHYFTRKLPLNSRGKPAQDSQVTPLPEMAETPVTSESSPKEKENMATELTSIRTILGILAKDLKEVKNGIESLNETVNNLGGRITEAEDRISRLKMKRLKLTR